MKNKILTLAIFMIFTLFFSVYALADENDSSITNETEDNSVVDKDTYPPSFSYIRPKSGTKDFNIESNVPVVYIGFQEVISRGQNFERIIYVDSKNNIVPIQKIISNDPENTSSSIICTPQITLDYNEKYTIIVPKGAVIDKSGNENTDEIRTWFTTISAPPALVIDGMNPGNNSKLSGVKVPTINITFNQNIYKNLSEDYDNIRLVNKDINAYYLFDKSISGNKLILKPYGIQQLNPNTKYYLEIPKNALETSRGATLEGDKTLSFTSGQDNISPYMIYCTPEDGVTGVTTFPNEFRGRLTFSEKIVAGPNFNKVQLIDAHNIKVPIIRSITIGESATAYRYELNINIMSQLKCLRKYTIIVPKGAVKDTSGNINDKEIRISFTAFGTDYYKENPEDDTYYLVSEDKIVKPNEGENPDTMEKTINDGVKFVDVDKDSFESNSNNLNTSSSFDESISHNQENKSLVKEGYIEEDQSDGENTIELSMNEAIIEDKEDTDSNIVKNNNKQQQDLKNNITEISKSSEKAEDQNKFLANDSVTKYFGFTIMICFTIFIAYEIIIKKK